MTVDEAPIEVPADADPSKFRVRLLNFEGPFDLLLSLISQHRLDVTEVALHTVTDDFISFTKSLGADVGLDQTTEFLVVAATLLDLKAARLLPSGDVEDAEDLALLEVRDLLFARLLQYRAYKQVALLFGELEAAALRRSVSSAAIRFSAARTRATEEPTADASCSSEAGVSTMSRTASSADASVASSSSPDSSTSSSSSSGSAFMRSPLP